MISRLVNVSYFQKNYEAVAQYSLIIENSSEFKKSKSKLYYAWALFHLNRLEEATTVFKELDTPYSNYEQRLD